MCFSNAGVRLFTLAVITLLLAACDASSLTDSNLAEARSDSQITEPSDPAARPVGAQLAAVRALTAPYHNFSAGEAAGWNADISFGCVPEMGHHYGRAEYLNDGGFVDALQPEVLLYEPQRNGRKRLVGVEYVVPVEPEGEGPPFPQPDEDPPVLFGEEFHWNAGLSLWMLHVWIWKHNPDGMFTDFNPNVSCDWAS